MFRVRLSEAEKTFILHGVEADFRADGRSGRDYRPMELETGLLSNCAGSARFRLANTDILVGIKTEIDKPSLNAPNKGKIEFYVDCSANATPAFEGRGGEQLAEELADALRNTFQSPLSFDRKALCILPGKHCWKLYVDVLILECGGNLFDAVSLATKSALYNTKIPKVTAALMDAGETELVITDDPHDCTRINTENIPILVTVYRIGNACVVDASMEEEQCSQASVVIGLFRQGEKMRVAYSHMVGRGSLAVATMTKAMELAMSAGEVMDQELIKALKLEEKRLLTENQEKVGFLR